MAIDKAYDDLQEARGRIQELEEALEHAANNTAAADFAQEVEFLKAEIAALKEAK